MMTLTTPALLFPAISLLLLAYTNRFLTVAQVIRQLRTAADQDPSAQHNVKAQLKSLKTRMVVIKRMQLFGVIAFLLCTLSMFSLFIQQELAGEIMFGASLLLLSASLVLSLYEVALSTQALNYALDDLERL